MKLKPLDPMDYSFVIGESRQQMLHVGSLIIYNVPKDQDADIVATEMHEDMLSFEQAHNPFNYKLIKKMGRYFWQEDEEFDVSNHVRHVRLPYPGTLKELNKIIGVIHGIQMDRSLPLWMVWIISGLPDNQFAVYGKMHHALVDGISGARLIQSVHSEDPNERDMPPFWAIDRSKKGSRDIGTRPKKGLDLPAMANQASKALKGAATSGSTVLGNLFKSLKENHESLNRNKMFYTPQTILNQKITGARRFVYGSFDMERMRAVAKTFDGSLNDSLVLMTSYTLRKYLRDLKQLPKDDMYVAMPVSLRSKTDKSMGGNQIALMRTRLGTNVPHTRTRIKEVMDYMGEQKELYGSMNKMELAAYSGLALAPVFAQISTGKVPNLQTVNLVLSNVPGPKEPLYMNGLEVDGMYPVSLPLNQLAVNFTMLSYNGQMNLGITGCRTRLPHLQRMMDYMHEALDDLEIATGIKKRRTKVSATKK